MPAAIESFGEFRELINGETPVIIDFWATWCGPCKTIAPHFEALEKEFPNVLFRKVDVDAHDMIAQEVGIRSMPTFMVLYKGQKIDSFSGAVPAKLAAMLQGLPERIPGFKGPRVEA